MIQNRVGELVIYAPLLRLFDYDAVPQGEAYKWIGRVFEVTAVSAEMGQSDRLRPFESTEVIFGHRAYMLPMGCFPPVPEAREVQLPSESSRSFELWGAYEPIALNLSPATRNPRYRHYFLYEDWESDGLVRGCRYEIEEWVVPNKAIRIKGFPMVFYAGFFDLYPQPAEKWYRYP